MADFIFKISPNIVLGPYVSVRLGQHVSEYGSRFMIVFDPALKNTGIKEKLLSSLDESNVKYFIFESLSSGANSKEVQEIIKICSEAHIQGVIAIGGMKTLNVGKTVCSLVNEDFTVHDYIDGKIPVNSALPLIYVPTTYRMPFSFSSLISLTDSRLSSVKIMPSQKDICKLVLCDPEFTKALPKKLSVPMLLEILCMAVEAYISPKASFFSDMFVEKAVELLGPVFNPEKCPDTSQAKEVTICQAGCMISLAASFSSPGIASLLSLASHSRLRTNVSEFSCVLFNYVLSDGATFAAEKISRLAKLLKIADESEEPSAACEKFALFVDEYVAKNNLPQTISQLGETILTVDHIALIAQDASQLEMINNLPKSMTSDTLFEVLKEYL